MSSAGSLGVLLTEAAERPLDTPALGGKQLSSLIGIHQITLPSPLRQDRSSGLQVLRPDDDLLRAADSQAVARAGAVVRDAVGAADAFVSQQGAEELGLGFRGNDFCDGEVVHTNR
jgi:hypothetical protein